MPRLPQPPRRIAGLVAFTLLLAALLVPVLRDAGAQSTLGTPIILPGDLSSSPAAGTQEAPQVSRGDATSLAVWVDSRTVLADSAPLTGGNVPGAGSLQDIYAARIGADGEVIDTTPLIISQAQHEQGNPRVGWNGQNWLVTWLTKRPRDQFSHTYDVAAARVSPEGVLLDQTHLVLREDVAPDEFASAITDDGQGNWVVVWHATLPQEGTSIPRGIFVTKVSNDGAIVDGPRLVYNHHSQFLGDAKIERAGDRYLVTFIASGPPYRLMGLTYDASFTPLRNGPEVLAGNAIGYDIATDGQTWFASWGNGASGNVQMLYATRVSREGDPLDPGGILVNPNVGVSPPHTSVAWDGQFWVIAYSTGYNPSTGQYLFGGDDIYVTRVNAAGQVQDETGIPLTVAAGHQGAPAITATPGAPAQVVWQDLAMRDVQTAQVPFPGNPTSVEPLALGAPRQSKARMASSGNGFLVVFRSEVSGVSRIMAQHLDAQGQPLDPGPFVIADGDGNDNPSVGWNGTNYLVVWDRLVAEAIGGRRTFARTVPATGPPLTPETAVMDGTTPDTAGLNGTFLVVNIIQETRQIRRTQAVRVSTTGTTLGTPVKIEGVFNFAPRVAAFGEQWLAVWEFHSNHDDAPGTIHAAFIRQDGTNTAPFTVGDVGNDLTPHLAVSGTQALVVWSHGDYIGRRGDINARRINADGSSPDPLSGAPVSNAPDVQAAPAVTWDGSQYVVTWFDQRNDQFPEQPRGDIFGARVSATNVRIEEFAVADSELPEATPFVIAQDGLTLFSYAAFYPQAPYAAYRTTLRAARFGAPSTGGTPAAPTGLVASQVNSGTGTVTLNWADNSDNEAGFKLEVRFGNGAYNQIRLLNANATSAVVEGVGINSAPSFRVRAYNAAGDSAYSNESSPPTAVMNAFSPNVLTEPVNVTATVTASDADGVARVEFSYATDATYPNYTLLGTDTSAPYSFHWQNVPAGYYYVRATAYDAAGARTTTDYQSFVVYRPPTGTITAPSANSRFAIGSNVSITATVQLHNASRGEFIRQVDFYANTTHLGTVQGHLSSYNFTWQNAPEGVYQLTARPTSSLDLTGTSEPVTVTIGNPGFNIAGRITDNANTPLYNVKVTLTGGRVAQTTTDAEGNYSFRNLPGGASYIVRPTISGYTFAPASRSFDALRDNQAADFSGTPETAAPPDPNAVAIYAQHPDGRGLEVSSKKPTGQQFDKEAADDFELLGTISRVVVAGGRDFNTASNPKVYGAFLRFYDGSSSVPGALQAEYYLPTGDPKLIYDRARPGRLDITLPTPFNATGRHFISAQLVTDDPGWYIGSADYPNYRGATWLVRDNLAEAPAWGSPFFPGDLAFSLYGELRSTPVITSLNPNPVTRSGLLRITGRFFGAAQGSNQLKIDGQVPPHIISWSDDLIVAYVPESAALGDVPVTVTTQAGTGTATATVTTRPSDGRIRWRFTLASDYTLHRPGIGPDGTVYVNDVSGRLYALTPDGALKWIFQAGDFAGGSVGPVSVAPDGTIYVAAWTPKDPNSQCPVQGTVNVHGVFAVNPDGTIKWRFAGTCDTIEVGPNLGPDGKIYGVTDIGGIGTFALTPEGQLAFSTGTFNESGGTGREIVFGRPGPGLPISQYYFQMDQATLSPQGKLFGYTLSGQKVFEVTTVESAQPAVGPLTGNIFTVSFPIGQGFRLESYTPQGAFRWQSPISVTSSLSAPDTGPDESVYVTRDGSVLHKVDPTTGQVVWSYDDPNMLFAPVASPDGRLVLIGGRVTFGEPGMFAAVGNDGRLLWRQFLPDEPGFEPYGQVVPINRARFTPDSQTAYIAADIAGDGAQPFSRTYSYFYALDTSAEDVPVNQPPSVTLTNPPNNSNVAGNTAVEVKASVTDDGPIARVEFFRNLRGTTERIGVVTEPGADGKYGVTFTPPGPDVYGLYAVAYDAAGLSGESPLVSIVVTNESPRVTWVTPTGGESFPQGANITLTAHPTDPDGTIARVEFNSSQIGPIGEDATADADGNYSVTFQNAGPAGTHQLYAWAVDDNGFKTNAVISVTIVSDETPPPPPTPTPTPTPPNPNAPQVTITSPADNSSFVPGTNVTITATATDPDGTIARVDFINEPWGTNICTDVNAPYTCTFTRGESYLYDIVAVARDNSGLTTRSAPVRILFEETQKFTIAGRLRHNESAPGNELFLPNAVVNLRMNFQPYRQTRTDAQGNYRFENLAGGGNFEVTPAEPGYNFFPPSVIYDGLVSNQTADFTAEGPRPGPTPTPTPGASALAWERTFNSSYGLSDFDPLVTVDSQGNTYVTGTAALAGDRGDTDIVTVKYGPDGTRAWARSFVGLGAYKDWPTDIATDSAGNVYVTGTSWRGSAFSYDLVTIKYATDGTEQWVRYRNGPLGGSDFSNALALDAQGNVLVTGYERMSDNSTGRSFDRFVTVKYSAAGAEQWAATRTQAQIGDHAVDVATDADGNVYVTGFAWTSAGQTTTKDILTVKYSAAGVEQWAAIQDGRPGEPGPTPQPDAPIEDEPGGIALDSQGNVYVFGSNVPGNAQDDFLLLRYNSQTGALVWGRNWSGPAYDYARDMAIDAAGNIYLTGESYDIVFQTVSDYPTSDVATVKFDASGNLLWERIYRAFPGKNDGGQRIALDSAGNAYVGARSEGFVNSDTAVIKYQPDGTERWVFRYDNPQHTNDQLSDMAADAAGNLYLAGDAPFTQPGSTSETVDLVTVKLAASTASLNSPPEVRVDVGPTIAGAPVAHDTGAAGDNDPLTPNGPTIAGRSLLLTAEAFDLDGTVAQVDFYNGPVYIGTDASAPYAFEWKNVAPGTYAITATATDNLGATRTAQTQLVTVTDEPAPTPSPTPTNRVNHALSSAGASASASSEFSSAYSADAAINGSRFGLQMPDGRYNLWNSAHGAAKPDRLQVSFAAPRSVDEVVVVTQQDAYWTSVEPTEQMTFSSYGIRDFEVQYLDSNNNWVTVTGGAVTGNDRVLRRFSFPAVTTTAVRVVIHSTADGYSRVWELEAWGQSGTAPTPTPTPTPAPTNRVNHALSSAGASASASSEFSSAYSADAAINGSRFGLQMPDGRYNLWNSAHGAAKPDRLQVSFAAPRSVDEVVVVTQQDAYWASVEPTEQMTFSSYGIRDFEVQYLNASNNWVTVSGGSVTGNDRVLRRFSFPAVTTTAVRLLIHSTADGYSRVWELEAWGEAAVPAPVSDGRVNHALSSAGASASASSEFSSAYSADAAINGSRFGLQMPDGRYNLWNSAHGAAKPDRLQVSFAAPRSVDEVVVVTQQDAYWASVEPTEQMTFSSYGIRDFEVQYLDSNNNWVTVPSGNVTGNDRVMRRFSFPAVTTTAVRLLIHSTADGYSRVWELEAWGQSGEGVAPNAQPK